MPASVLVIDDDEDMCQLIQEFLQKFGYAVTWRLGGNEALELYREQDFDVVVTDLKLAGSSGLDLCRRFVENRPGTPVIVITGAGDMASAIGAIRAGAQDFITKPVDMTVLQHAIQRALLNRSLGEKVQRLKQAAGTAPPAGAAGLLIGRSPAMGAVFDLVRRVAASDTTVLVQGESGTGKELVARAIHEQSTRSGGPFVAINCAAVPMELLESELFGHMKGAFTDAKEGRQGLFAQAANGTLLLDEIGEMPLELQPKLLRVLQERQVRPVGGNGSVAMTARIIAASNRDLEREVEQRRFREDLFYRLNVVPIEVPPLRARGYDVKVLADHFLGKFTARLGKTIHGFAPEAELRLMGYDWPGNVRQLENCVERAVALTRNDRIQLEDLPERIVKFDASIIALGDVGLQHMPTLDQVQVQHIDRAIQRARGNKTRAAKSLGIDRRTLYRKLESSVRSSPSRSGGSSD